MGEVDLVGIECKSGATVASDALHDLERLQETPGKTHAVGRSVLVYGGEQRQRRTAADVVPWHAVGRVRWFGR